MRTLRRRTTEYLCERLETRLVLNGSLELSPYVISLMENGKLRTPGVGLPFDTQATPPEEAPPLAGTFEGVNFDGDGAATGFYHVPPDPHGAVGPNHVVNVVNTTIQWFTKAGVNQNTQRLGRNGATAVGSFFAAQSPVTGTFDPKVLYDQHNGRFVVVTLERVDSGVANSAANVSRILLAVSDDSDPNGTWYTTAINSKISIDGVERWADYPGFAVDDDAIFITANMFGFTNAGIFGGSRLWIVNKTGFYTGGAVTQNVYDFSSLSGAPFQIFTAQPAHMYGAPPGSTGTFLVDTITFVINPNREVLSVVRVDNPTSSPSFEFSAFDLGNIDNQSTFSMTVPQSGTGFTLMANDRRALDAVWRNDNLYLVNTMTPNSGVDSGTATARWWQIDTTNLAALTLADNGIVSGEDIAANTRTFFPSISVDENDNVAIGFSASGPNIFPGAYYTGRLSTDAPGTVQASSVLAAGVAFYRRDFGGGNRWGDYSAISIDPSNGTSFWVYNMYASTQGSPAGTGQGRWATRWGTFSFAAVPAAPSTPDLDPGSDSGFLNVDNITMDNTPTFTGTAEAGSTVTIFVNGINVGSGVAAGGNYSVTTSALADGAKNVQATATNGAGPSPLSGTLAMSVDTTAPIAGAAVFDFLTAGQSLNIPFDENVNNPALATTDFTLQDRDTLAFIAPGDMLVGYNGGSNTASITFPGLGGILPDGNYRSTVVSAGVVDAAGNPAAGTLQTDFSFLQGDLDSDRKVTTLDFNIFAANFGTDGVWSQGNLDYSIDAGADINSMDFAIFVSKYGKQLPPPAPELSPQLAALPLASAMPPALFSTSPIDSSTDQEESI